MRGTAICAAVAIAALTAAAGTIEIRNTTGGFDILHVYVAAFGARTWGEDRMADSTLTEGGAWSLQVPGGIYSIRLVDEDGDTYTKLSVPVMDTLRWDVTLDDLDSNIPASGYSSG